MSLIKISAVVFSIAILFSVCFQIGLALGFPWGDYANGGKFPGRLPLAMRVVAVFQSLLLIFFGYVVLSRSGLLSAEWASPSWLIWIVVGFSVVAVILNSITPSKKERRVWLPVALIMALTSSIVATMLAT